MKLLLTFIIFLFLYANTAFALTFESISILNTANFAKYFNTYLGDYYNSHGCLHFSPSDIYLLAKTIPSGIPIEISAYGDDMLPFDTEKLKFFNELVNSTDDLNYVASYFKSNKTKLLVYPSLNRLYIVVNDKPYAQVKTQAGPPNYYRMVMRLQKGKQIDWDNGLATPTDPGDYTILGSKPHYISPTYYQTTIIPFGSQLKKSEYGWVFENNGKWFQVPKIIAEDLSSPYEQNEYNYYDVQLDNNGKISSARWGSHDFGKYVLLWTKDGKNYYPELGYAEGQLVFEQIKLTEDLGYILTVPGSDELDSCISQNKNFLIYRDIYLFIESKGNYVSNKLDPTACSYYKLFNKFKLSEEDLKSLDPRVVDAVNIFRNKKLPWLPWERDRREKLIGLYYFARDYNLAFQKQANWYKKTKDNWLFWKTLREKLREDFKKMGVFSQENQKHIVENWLNDRLELKKVSTPQQIQKLKNETFFSFFLEEDSFPKFAEREKNAMREILRRSSKGDMEGLMLNSVDALNNYNFGVLLDKMLGNLYKSHGCLHVTPRNSYLLYTLFPLGGKIKIFDYSKKYDEHEFLSIPYLTELANFKEDLNKLKESFSNPSSVEVDVYPSSGNWIIYLDKKAFAKLSIEAGPKNKRYVLEGRAQSGNPIFEKHLAYPTEPGIFYVFKAAEDYVSNTYYDLTIMPMGTLMKKDRNKWIFNKEGRWFSVPKEIAQDLDSSSKEKNYNYYDMIKDEKGSIIQAKWGDHPFGKYSILISPDKKYPSPQIIHSSGNLIMEQRQLVKDLLKVLSAPFDKFEDCIKFSSNFDFYRKCNEFVLNPDKENLPGTIESISYKTYYDLPLKKEELNAIPADVLIANKIIKEKGKLTNQEKNILLKEGIATKSGKGIKINMEKILGIQFDTYQYVVAIKKYAHHYEVLKEHWDELSDLRNAMLKDFKNFVIKDPVVFYNFNRELILKRMDFEKLSQQETIKLLNEFLDSD